MGSECTLFRFLCPLQFPSGLEELQEIAYRTHQLPCVADVQFAAQAEAAKTALFLMCPKTGSTIALRILYTARPASVRNLRCIVSFGDASGDGGSPIVSTPPPRGS